MKLGRHFVWALLGCLVNATLLQGAEPVKQTELIVYGGTASGVMTAYSASREGLHVVLLEPGVHLGGMVTGGLSATDLGHFAIIGGYARDFYRKAAAHYGIHDLNRAENWLSEPHVDEEIFDDILKRSGVEVVFHERLREKNGVETRGRRIVSIATEDGKRWQAAVFADCTYEGDLMAQANVSYTWGRESSQQYGENLAGVREHTPGHQFGWAMSPYEANHHLLPDVDPGPLAAPGSGDKKVQAYNLRLILTNDPANQFVCTLATLAERSPFRKRDAVPNCRGLKVGYQTRSTFGRRPQWHVPLGERSSSEEYGTGSKCPGAQSASNEEVHPTARNNVASHPAWNSGRPHSPYRRRVPTL